MGAVVGATYPEMGKVLRKIMPKAYILVPGYGAQGGQGKDLVHFFNEDGLGAIVNSSRGIIAAWKQEKYASFGAEAFGDASRAAVEDMVADIEAPCKPVNTAYRSRREKMTRKKEQVRVSPRNSLRRGSSACGSNGGGEARPGQFISMYTNDGTKLLPRPISICEIDREAAPCGSCYRVTGEIRGQSSSPG